VALTFRWRLTLFFLLIVVVPMVAVGVLVLDVTEESVTGKADARLAAELESAISLHQQDLADARVAARAVARDRRIGEALVAGDQARIQSVARELADEHGARSLRINDRNGRELVAIGRRDLFGASELELERTDQPIGSLALSTTSPAAFLARIEGLVADDVVIVGHDGPLAASVPAGEIELPAAGEATDVEIDGTMMRAAAASLPGEDELRVVIVGDLDRSGLLASSPRVVAALAAFFAVALVFVLMLSGSLQAQIAAMLDAARRIGGGDFSREVPVVGRDEMAGLASEFNKMSARLSEQMNELKRQRVEIERSVKRLGEAFASGLDRSALLGIVVDTVVGACEADYALIALREGAQAKAGEASRAMHEAARAAEERAMGEREIVEERRDDAYAIGGALARIGRPQEALGAMTIARAGRPFGAAERDVFRYFIGQASASVENVALHELVSEQAVTDELTGLANPRAFRDVIEREAARAERFGHDLSLLMLDIDDFKAVNDAHGHLQGDEILRAVGRVLTSESRGVDEPARYGGEEFAVALPETDAEGAFELGERIRTRLEAEPISSLDGGSDLHVTASVGVATFPESADGPRGLISAADQALYEAKRAGKNQVRAARGRDGASRR
jgi:diguanylate cyclase (GGDEF)-like protein